MKRVDIVCGDWYAVKLPGYREPKRCVILERGNGYCQVQRHDRETYQQVVLPSVLMPWPAWEAEQERKRAADREVQEQRTLRQIKRGSELAIALTKRGILTYEFSSERESVTIGWEDLAKLLGLEPAQ